MPRKKSTIKRVRPKVPKALMDVDPRIRGRLQRGYTFSPSVPISDILLEPAWNKLRLEDNLKKLKKTGAMPPVLLHLDLKTQKYRIEDGIHRIHAGKRLGYTHVPAVWA